MVCALCIYNDMSRAWGSLMYFEIESNEDMKSFDENLKFQSLTFNPETFSL